MSEFAEEQGSSGLYICVQKHGTQDRETVKKPHAVR